MTLPTGDRRASVKMPRTSRKFWILFVTLALVAIAAPSYAHHPAENLDAVLGSKEKYFQAIDRTAPEFLLRNTDGQPVKLADFRDKIVVLNFVYTKCPDICPLHAEKIAEIQGMINGTPMRDLVQFITITTDPENDTADVLKAYGPAHGLDPFNWSFLTTIPGQPKDSTRTLAQAYGHKFTKTGDGYQAHGIVTHIIDRNGRWAANFHGLRFSPINMVLYINGLTNNADHSEKPKAGSFWSRVKGLFQ